jgi:hypothetical protein
MENNIKASTFGTLHNDLYFNKKVSISFDSFNYDENADYKVMVQIEPPSIMGIINQIHSFKNNFDLILTWNTEVLEECENSELFPFGSCWINESDRGIHNKTKILSIVASNKRQTEGHRLRHTIIDSNLTPMDTYGRGYNPIENKITAFKDYMFSLIIENEKIDNLFTEKIIDCLVTGTVPIYWGCGNIGNYFDKRGFLEFNSVDEFKGMIEKLNLETYNNMLPFIKNNFELSLIYTNFWGRLVSVINNKMNILNIEN